MALVAYADFLPAITFTVGFPTNTAVPYGSDVGSPGPIGATVVDREVVDTGAPATDHRC